MGKVLFCFWKLADFTEKTCFEVEFGWGYDTNIVCAVMRHIRLPQYTGTKVLEAKRQAASHVQLVLYVETFIDSEQALTIRFGL